MLIDSSLALKTSEEEQDGEEGASLPKNNADYSSDKLALKDRTSATV